MSRPKYRISQKPRRKINKKKKQSMAIFIAVLMFLSIVISIILITLPLL